MRISDGMGLTPCYSRVKTRVGEQIPAGIVAMSRDSRPGTADPVASGVRDRCRTWAQGQFTRAVSPAGVVVPRPQGPPGPRCLPGGPPPCPGSSPQEPPPLGGVLTLQRCVCSEEMPAAQGGAWSRVNPFSRRVFRVPPGAARRWFWDGRREHH